MPSSMTCAAWPAPTGLRWSSAPSTRIRRPPWPEPPIASMRSPPAASAEPAVLDNSASEGVAKVAGGEDGATTATAAASPGNNARNAVRATTSPGRVPASSKPMKFPLVPNASASLSGVSVGLSGVASLGVSAVPSPAEDLGAASAARAPRGAHHRSGPDSSKAAAYSHGDLASAVGPGPRAPGVFSSAAAPAKKRRPPRLQLASDNAAPLEDAGTPLLALNGDGANVGACHVVGDAPGTRDLGGLGPAGGFGGCGGARASLRKAALEGWRKSPRTWSPATTPAENESPAIDPVLFLTTPR